MEWIDTGMGSIGVYPGKEWFAANAVSVIAKHIAGERAIRRKLWEKYGHKFDRYNDGCVDRENLELSLTESNFFASRVDPTIQSGDLGVIRMDAVILVKNAHNGCPWRKTGEWYVEVRLGECIRKSHEGPLVYSEWKFEPTGRYISEEWLVEDVPPPCILHKIASWGGGRRGEE